jgi:hypothetical protein
MPSRAPDWDLLITAPGEEQDYDRWFPAGKILDCKNLIALEGVRFRNVYLTSKAIEQGSASLFGVLYRTAKMMRGSVLHTSDYREYE